MNKIRITTFHIIQVGLISLISLLNLESNAQCPTITCPGNVVLYADSSICNGISVTYSVPVGVDTCSGALPFDSIIFNYTGSIDTFTVPTGVDSLIIETYGAQGGGASSIGGKGAFLRGKFAVSSGQKIKILVGQQGQTNYGYGGGGGSFVATINDVPMIIAGGGGGAEHNNTYPGFDAVLDTNGTSIQNASGGTAGSGGEMGDPNTSGCGWPGGGGGGFYGDGGTSGDGGGDAFIHGGAGGTDPSGNCVVAGSGGFGGGGSGGNAGGGGGGYSGGAGGANIGLVPNRGGGGGGSYNVGSDQLSQAGVKTGNGLIKISYKPQPSTTLISGKTSGSLFPIGITTNTYQVISGTDTATCSFSISIIDTIAPQFTCHADTVSLDTIVNGIAPAVLSVCSTDSIMYVLSGATSGFGYDDASGTDFNKGVTTVTYIGWDVSGNRDSCSFNVTIGQPTYDTLTLAECESYTSPSTHFVWNTSGTYYDTLVNSQFSDSLITIYLTINHGTHDTVAYTAMDTFTTASGMKITHSGVYLDTVANQYGCDSILTYNLTITQKLFVNGGIGSSGNGASWGSPFRTLKEATDAANTTNNTVEIWVKAGTYAPDNNGSTGRTSTFLLTNINTKLYGGFNGSESSRDQRDPANNRTVLSGDIGISGNSSDNCFHVLSIIDTRPVSGGEEPLDTSFVIDGFVISGANANGSSKNLYGSKSIWKNQGGGILIYSDGLNRQMSPLINNCLFENNYADFGSGIYIEVPNGSSDAMISNCIFQNNAADYGTIYNNGNAGDISPMILNCVFDQNSAHTSGAGIYNFGYNGNASPSVLNCVFSQNSAINQGGAIYNNGYAGVCSTYVANSTFFANSAGTAAGMMGNYGKSGTCSPSVVNCVSNSNQANGSSLSNRSEIYNFSASPSFSYCAMQMDSADYSSESFNNLGSGSNNQFGVNPSFSNSANPDGSDGVWMTSDDGLIPNSGSPLINAGTNSGTPAKDIRGINRSGNRDIGAYEKP